MLPSSSTVPSSLEEMRDWPHETILKLFELVKPHPVLYDPSHEQWTNKTHKGRLWTMIAKQLDPYLSSRRCRDRFVMIRRRFVTELRKQRARGNGSIDKSLMWLMYPVDEEKENSSQFALSFGSSDASGQSDPAHSPSQRVSSERHFDDVSSGTEDTCHMDAIGRGTFVGQLECSTTSCMSEFNEGERPMKKKRKCSVPRKIVSNDLPQPSVPVENAFVDFLGSLQHVQDQKHINEECEVFGRQVELDLRRLCHQNRVRARLEITQIIADLMEKEERGCASASAM